MLPPLLRPRENARQLALGSCLPLSVSIALMAATKHWTSVAQRNSLSEMVQQSRLRSRHVQSLLLLHSLLPAVLSSGQPHPTSASPSPIQPPRLDLIMSRLKSAPAIPYQLLLRPGVMDLTLRLSYFIQATSLVVVVPESA